MPVLLQAQRFTTMTERKENRNARRSRQMIREAFEQLLNLNCSTFYAHYPDIYGIVDEIQDEIIQQNMELFRQLEFR